MHPSIRCSATRLLSSSAAARRFAALASVLIGTLLAGCDSDILVVDDTTDGASGSLRAAIDAANERTGQPVRIEIAPGTYELTRCGSDDTNAGGDLDITTGVSVSLVANGPGVVIQQTCADERLLERHGAGALSVSGVTLRGGSTPADGGGIRAENLSLTEVTLTGNRARNGGAVAAGTLVAERLTVTQNSASERGGGVFVSTQATVARSTIGNNGAASGGGIVVDGTLQISESRITANGASRPVLFPRFYSQPTSGGGIHARALRGDRITVDNNALPSCIVPTGVNQGAGIWADSVSLTNSTITGNGSGSCIGSQSMVAGAAIRATSVTLEHVTIADNSPGSAIATQSLVSHRSLVVGPYGGTLCTGVVQSDSSYNRLGDGSCGTPGLGDTQGSKILLAPLADNGGPVPTRLPHLASELVHQIPLADCPVRVDARGTARPAGAACDIGAVEAQVPAGFGPADLAVAFVNPPASVTVGQTASWQVEVTNKGPNLQAPVVFIDTPENLSFGATASGGGACTNGKPVVCAFTTLAAGARERITFTTNWFPFSAVNLRAWIVARESIAPFADDEAQLRTPVITDATLRMEVAAIGEQVEVKVFNTGPLPALGTSEDPIRVTFHPAAGVHPSHPELTIEGLFNPEAYAIYSDRFTLTFDGAPPAQLGTVELDPGPNRASAPTTVPVFYRARADLRVSTWRAPGVAPVGSYIPVTVEVANIGPGLAENSRIELTLGVEATWSPPAGSVERTDTGYVWSIPSLAPGATLQLQGSVVAGAVPAWLFAKGVVSGDPNAGDDAMRLEMTAAPNGTADLEVTTLELTGEGPYYRVRTLITNRGTAATGTEPSEPVQIRVNGSWYLFSGPPGAPLSSSAEWFCGTDSCTSYVSLPAGSTHLFEFVAYSTEASPTFGVVVSSSSGAPDPDPRNNGSIITR